MDKSHQTIRFDDVADLYDYYVNVDFDIPYFLAEAKQARGKVLELTCGTGRVSIPLLQAGVDLTCIDYSEKMLGVLSEKLKRAHLSCNIMRMDITGLSLRQRYDLIFIPFNSFSEIVDSAKHLTTLLRIKEHLTDGGRFICTVQNPVVQLRSIDGKIKSLGKFKMNSDYWFEVKLQYDFNPTTRIVSGYQYYDIYNAKNMLIEKRKLAIRFYLFKKEEFEFLIQGAGLMVKALYGDYQYAPFNEDTSPCMIWVLEIRR